MIRRTRGQAFVQRGLSSIFLQGRKGERGRKKGRRRKAIVVRAVQRRRRKWRNSSERTGKRGGQSIGSLELFFGRKKRVDTRGG